jgi:catechol 1,2-dioxygenase
VIRNADDVTAAVLRELTRAPDARFREVMSSAVRHLHAWAREVHLTEAEFRKAAAIVARAGQLTDKSHNEVVLCAGSLGLSALVCLMNNGEQGARETTANLLGPFWRAGSPRMENGASIVRSPTPGELLAVTAMVRDLDGKPVAGADVDVWHASAEGLYENQDAQQADMNLRGTFTTDAEGKISFRTIKPSGYPIPVAGVAGDLLRAQGRHNMRPAHIHFLIYKPGYKTQFSQVYASDDPNLETDAQFGVTRALVGEYVRQADGSYTLHHEFVIEPGEAKLPEPPITGKAS